MNVQRILRFLLPALVLSVSYQPALSQSMSTKRGPQDSRVRVAGVITNSAITSGKPLWIALTVTNVSGADLYVPKHFNSNNYSFETPGGMSSCHGDSRGAVFEDFIRLKPKGAMTITHGFTMNEEVGKGVFSVHFYNNLLPDVEQKLKATGIPFVIEINHSFGKIRLNASNPHRI
jgi:hypothetical protein